MEEVFRRIQLIVEEMLAVAGSGDAVCEDDGCRVLLGVLRDSAYKIRRATEHELLAHQLSKRRASGRP